MMPRTAIAQIGKMIGRELDTGAGSSEEALAAGPILAEADATTEIIGSLLAEVHRQRPNDRMIAGYAFILEGALGTLRPQSSGGDIEADRAIAEVRHRLDLDAWASSIDHRCEKRVRGQATGTRKCVTACCSALGQKCSAMSRSAPTPRLARAVLVLQDVAPRGHILDTSDPFGKYRAGG
jgi:hypothetical protein